MCCAIQYPKMPLQMDLIEEKYSFRLSSKQAARSKIGRSIKKTAETEVSTTQTEQQSEPTKQVSASTSSGAVTGKSSVFPPKRVCTDRDETKLPVGQCPEQKTDAMTSHQKKKKKWKSVSLADTGFAISLFPRPMRPEMIDPEEEREILATIEKDLEAYDDTVEKYVDFDVTRSEVFEGRLANSDKLARKNRFRKVRKAGKQVKDKYCKSLKNNKGRKDLFIHHRLFKLINLEDKRLNLHLPSRSKHNDNCIISNRANRNTNETRSRLSTGRPAPSNPRPPPVQNLRYALQTNNASNDLQRDLVSVLINIQHRELTPEDYDLLLRLDESVQPKTLDKNLINTFKTDIVSESTCGDICAVCMDPYEIGQTRKFLPCDHVFHDKCINMWLENSSRNCPIDGLPIDESS